jgi:MoaA/NifB/PqqE/SkfB family radical SAM enzyme
MFNKKILCIGNETELTDQLTSTLAAKDATTNHGLISADNFSPIEFGYYHTSIADLSPGSIVLNLAPKFDSIVMLDISVDQYPHWKSFVNTFRLMIELEEKGYNTVFRNNSSNTDILYWYNTLRTNKALCALPFLNLINDYGSAVMCPKCSDPVTNIDLIEDWSTDPAFAPIRNNMLNGIQMPDKCSICYEREQHTGESARQFESLEWAVELRLTRKEDLKNIKYPVNYEIRPSNKCNIMCRMCDDKHSHLIEEENVRLGIPVVTDTWNFQEFPYDKIDFDTVKRIYWAGGEPTIFPEFYAFLRRCIKQNQTDFDLNIGTNAQKISNTLLDLLKEFPRVTFSVSFDGYKKINDYVRWGSNFDTMRDNCFRILEQGHAIGFQTVISLYNATRIHEIYEFYDRDFPKCNSLVQPAGGVGSYLGPWHNPLRKQVLESMYRCQETKVYYNGGRNTSYVINEIIDRFKNYNYDPNILIEFFRYNDQLDYARGSRLGDYIPELEQARLLVLK